MNLNVTVWQHFCHNFVFLFCYLNFHSYILMGIAGKYFKDVYKKKKFCFWLLKIGLATSKVYLSFTISLRYVTYITLFYKACVRYFLSNFYFLPNDSPSKAMQNVFLFHLKRSFRSWDIQGFVFSSSPLSFPVSHCFRGWSKKNLKIYDVIICVNKNLITHFVWYLDKDISCDIENLSIDRELNKGNFYRKIMQKMCTNS